MQRLGGIAAALWPLGLALTLLATAPAQATGLPAVAISNVSDIAFSNWGMGDPDATAHIDLCVYATLTIPLGSYGITAAGTGGFVLKNAGNSSLQIPYSVSWDDGGAGNLGSAATAVTSGAKLTSQANANSLVQSCSGPTARLNVKVAATDLTAALAGTYSGTLTITISPN